MDVWLKFNGVQLKWACGNVAFRRRLPSPCTLVVNVPDGMVVRQKYFIYLQGYLPDGVGTPITHQEGEANQTGSVKMTEVSIFSDVITGSDIKRALLKSACRKKSLISCLISRISTWPSRSCLLKVVSLYKSRVRSPIGGSRIRPWWTLYFIVGWMIGLFIPMQSLRI